MLDSWMYDNDSIFCKLQVVFVNRNFKRAATRNAYVLMIPAIAPTAFHLPSFQIGLFVWMILTNFRHNCLLLSVISFL